MKQSPPPLLFLLRLFFVWFRFGFNPEEHFTVPAEVTEHFAAVKESGSKKEADYHTLFAAYEVTCDFIP